MYTSVGHGSTYTTVRVLVDTHTHTPTYTTVRVLVDPHTHTPTYTTVRVLVDTHTHTPTYTTVRVLVDPHTHLSHPELFSVLCSILCLDKAESKFLHTRQLQRKGAAVHVR